MPDSNQSKTRKLTPREAYTGPQLLYSRYKICGMLDIGLTLCDEMFADGTIEEVKIGRRKLGTAKSVHRAAKANTP